MSIRSLTLHARRAGVLLIGLVATAAIISLLRLTPAQGGPIESDDLTYAATHLDFANAPALSESVTVTLAITPEVGFTAAISIEVPTGVDIDGGYPGGYSIDDEVISWDSEELVQSAMHEYEVLIEPTSPVTGWLLGRVRFDGDELLAGQAGVAFKVDSGGSVVTYTGEGVIPITAPENNALLVADTPLSVRLIWSRFPGAGEAATVTAIVTNTLASSVEYTGTLSLPSAWSHTSNSDSWTNTLAGGAGEATAFSVTAASDLVPWEVELVIDLGAMDDDDYRITDVGAFREDGRPYYEGQARERVADAGGMGHLGPDNSGRHLGLARVVASRSVHPASQFICQLGEAYLHGQVIAAGYPAWELRAQLDWAIPSSSPLWTGRSYLLMRLDDDGRYEACIPVAGDPVVFMTVWATDAMGFFWDGDWSAKVSRTGQTHRLYSVHMPGPTLGSPTTVEHDFVVDNHVEDATPFRLAASVVYHTREFMRQHPSPTVNMRDTGRARSGWQADIRLYAPCGYGLEMIHADTRIQNSLQEAMVCANHEYGHFSMEALQGIYAPCGPGCTPWVEGFADMFSAAVWSDRFEGDAGNGGNATYGSPLDILEEAMPAAHRLHDAQQNITAVGAGLWDLWDPVDDEEHPGVPYYTPFPPEPTSTTLAGTPTSTPPPTPTQPPTLEAHTLDDDVPNVFGDAWEVVGSMNVSAPCDFYAQWGAQGRPYPTEVVEVLDHSGWSACAGVTPVPTQTPGPSPSPTP